MIKNIVIKFLCNWTPPSQSLTFQIWHHIPTCWLTRTQIYTVNVLFDFKNEILQIRTFTIKSAGLWHFHFTGYQSWNSRTTTTSFTNRNRFNAHLLQITTSSCRTRRNSTFASCIRRKFIRQQTTIHIHSTSTCLLLLLLNILLTLLTSLHTTLTNINILLLLLLLLLLHTPLQSHTSFLNSNLAFLHCKCTLL